LAPRARRERERRGRKGAVENSPTIFSKNQKNKKKLFLFLFFLQKQENRKRARISSDAARQDKSKEPKE
jgi:hypothetical protein